MSREVLGASGPDADTPAPSSAPAPWRRAAAQITDLDEPPARATAAPTGADEASDTLLVDLDEPPPDGDTRTATPAVARPTESAPPDPDAQQQQPAHQAARQPPHQPPPQQLPWWRRPWAVVAAAAIGALLATLVTASVLERRHAEDRLAATRLMADLQLRDFGQQMHTDGTADVDLVVYNAGQDSVAVTGVDLPGATDGWRVQLRRDTNVPAGRTVRIPAEVRLDCRQAPPRQLELQVRTADGRSRDVQPASAMAAIDNGLGLEIFGWLCTTDAGGVEIWSTRALDDGTLALTMRNPTDEQITVAFSGPTGTQILSDPPSPITLQARTGIAVHLTIQVDRCTAAAQRATAGDDLRMTVDEQQQSLPTDPAVLAGWLARTVALTCN